MQFVQSLLWLQSCRMCSNAFYIVKKKFRNILITLLIFFTIKIIIQHPNILKMDKTSKINVEKFTDSSVFKRNNLNLNDVVLEEENVGREEGDIMNPRKDYVKENWNKDLNAAAEALSQQQNEKEVFPIPNIDDEIANLRKKGNPSTYSRNQYYPEKLVHRDNVWSKSFLKDEGYWNYQNFSDKEIKQLSVLGRRLFLHENIGIEAKRGFLIYVYIFGKHLEKRLIKHYSKENMDPFENCSVHNCKLTYNHSDFHIADAVLFHLHLLKGPPTELTRKNFDQRWVWLSDESPFNTFMVARNKNFTFYNNFFNWSMTYRAESDVPVPYGRTVPFLEGYSLTTLDLDIFSKKKKNIAIMGSYCWGQNNRWKFVKRLEKYIEIDTYGNCGRYKCPGHFTRDCHHLQFYKFYLAFENSNCKEYITEKLWWNAFAKEAVPVVMGAASKADYQKFLPPNSFIYVDDFNTAEDLAEYLRFLSNNKEEYNKYHEWRAKYRVLNEHGYFETSVFHYCRLCEALNYNSPLPKTYNSMEAFWNKSRDCNNRRRY